MAADLKPLGQGLIAAEAMRRMAHDLILQAQALEAEAAKDSPTTSNKVEFAFSRKRAAARKPVGRSKKS